MSRDLDSHFGEREQAAVEEWLRQSFAIMSLLYVHKSKKMPSLLQGLNFGSK